MTEDDFIWVSNKQTLLCMLEMTNHLLPGDNWGVAPEDEELLRQLVVKMFQRCVTFKEVKSD